MKRRQFISLLGEAALAPIAGPQVCADPPANCAAPAKLKADHDQSYGYFWWLGRSRLNGRLVPWIGALGRGGQSIRIVPELDLVVAVTAGYYQDYSPETFRLQYGVFRDVLQAISPPA
ncbi:hypothetical protein [Bradyrhizobium sp. CCBAU 53338]|uniref:hypothetical protein n=1 Tax=Bradyrhizobium sp. CCBAU 53338 TaxID=1325111 RepID=UPI001FF03535|nr:hypothetical protein [Bradyrhizobium sp. CCBAU 53338]